jgi:polysaccharide deacetylase 2 family uncharacterized protein YibQ
VKFRLSNIDWRKLNDDKAFKAKIGLAAVLIIFLAFFVDVLFSIENFKSFRETPAKQEKAPEKKEPKTKKIVEKKEQHIIQIHKKHEVSQDNRRARVAIILDDAGGRSVNYGMLFSIKQKLTLSVLPHLPTSYSVANDAKRAGMEIMLHLPMEADNPVFKWSGPGMILCSDDDDKIRRTVQEDVESVKLAKGFNNHMGSKATANARVMRAVFSAVSGNMYFINSKTTSSPISSGIARSLGVRTEDNSEFLDGIPSSIEITSRFRELIAKARRNGYAVGIGHATRHETIAVLKELMPYYESNGITFVYASEIVK